LLYTEKKVVLTLEYATWHVIDPTAQGFLPAGVDIPVTNQTRWTLNPDAKLKIVGDM
jgi:hypothetical protein